jgi:Ca2+-dependent lipid-binding protein
VQAATGNELLIYLSSSLYEDHIFQSARESKKPDPYLTIKIGSKTVQTAAVMRTNDPVYELGYTFLVQNPDTDTMTIKV